MWRHQMMTHFFTWCSISFARWTRDVGLVSCCKISVSQSERHWLRSVENEKICKNLLKWNPKITFSIAQILKLFIPFAGVFVSFSFTWIWYIQKSIQYNINLLAKIHFYLLNLDIWLITIFWNLYSE